jgi:hypothetical protein
VRGTVEHLQLAAITISALSLVPVVLALGRATGSRLGARAAAVSMVGANAVGALCVISNINSGDASFFTAVAVPSMLSWFVGCVVLAVAVGRSRALPKAYAFALPVTFLLGAVGSQVGGGILVAAFWLLVARRLAHGVLLLVADDVHDRVDERQVREGLREVAQVAAG